MPDRIGVVKPAERRRRRACGRKSTRRTTATTSSTIRRSPMPNSTRCCASSSARRRSTRNCAPPIRRPQRVGAAASERFAPYEHARPMLSLANAVDRRRVARVRRACAQARGRCDRRYVCELKIDGLAIALRLSTADRFARGGTRGDGSIGEDVTAKPAHGQDDSAAPAPGAERRDALVEVRGEVYLRKSDFDALNAAREREGLPVFANPRNAASGGVRQLDPALTAERRLSFFAYQIAAARRARAATQWEALQYLRDLGFPVNPNVASGSRRSTTSSRTAVIWEAQRDELDYEIDGVVVKVDDLALQERLGAVAARSALGDRVQVQAARSAHETARHRDQRRPHGHAQSGRDPRAGADRRRHREQRDPAQRSRTSRATTSASATRCS